VLNSSTGAGQADGAQARLPGPPRLADCITTYDQPDTANSSASAASCSTRCATHQLPARREASIALRLPADLGPASSAGLHYKQSTSLYRLRQLHTGPDLPSQLSRKLGQIRTRSIPRTRLLIRVRLCPWCARSAGKTAALMVAQEASAKAMTRITAGLAGHSDSLPSWDYARHSAPMMRWMIRSAACLPPQRPL